MAAKLAMLGLALVSTTGLAVEQVHQPPSFSARWQARAEPGNRLEECLIKVALPTSQDPAAYRRLVDRTWRARTSILLPIFFTYSRGRNLYVILNARCSRRSVLAEDLERDLHSGSGVQTYRVEAVLPDEARSVIAHIGDMIEGEP